MSTEALNPGGAKGLRIGSAATGEVEATILDLHDYGAGESGIEFLATDLRGNIYAGEVFNQRLVKFERLE